MSLRDKTSGKPLKVLSRDDKEGGDGDGNRRRDRDGRRREDRDRRREKERDAHEKPLQGAIVLLKRPESKSTGTGTTSGSVVSAETGDKTSSGPTLILQRSSKKEQDAAEHSDKSKSSAPVSVSELLKGPYIFPQGKALTLIDSKMKMCPWKTFDYDANNYPGNMDYLVITTIGKPNVGKSSILSYLAGNEAAFGDRKIFPPRTREEQMDTSVYISKDQIVLIELSSVFNQAAANDLIPLVSQQGVLEISNVTWNLRLVRWALSVSHIILIVSENVFEPHVFQLMNSAKIIPNMESALGEGSYPECIYICNKASLEQIDDRHMVNSFQEYFTSVTGRKPRIDNNYHVLPHLKYESEHYRFDRLRESIMDFNRYNRAPFAEDKNGLTKLIQKNNIQDWFQNAYRLWEEMYSPSYFSSYVKLLP